MKPRFRHYERKPFDAEKCTRCGECLARCPVMNLPPGQAKQEIEALIRYGQQPEALPKSTAKVLRACTSCFACNLLCPENCRPTNLFLDIWHQEYTRQGLPERARYFLPHSRPNFRTYLLDRFAEKEWDALHAWASLEPVETMFYPGCNLITMPSLLLSRIFEDLPIRGGLEYCCGEMYFRMGLYEQVEQAAATCTRYFRELGARTVYLSCTAGLNMFTHVLPQYGADFSGISFVPFLKYLYERLASGVLPIVKRFDGQTITLQDSCHAKIYEEDFDAWPRKILGHLGFEVIEAPKHGQNGLCCGIGSGFSHASGYAKTTLVAGQRACLSNLQKAGTDYIGVYCAGCLEMLALSESGGKMRHILELVQEAIGEVPERKHRGRAFKLAAGVLRNQRGGSGRFKPPPIE